MSTTDLDLSDIIIIIRVLRKGDLTGDDIGMVHRLLDLAYRQANHQYNASLLQIK
ncbi:MAG TPA: hypothetical protein VMU10_00220 [Desulfomonilia bacterium]|nr:hypothetical protein [Desulfomonilia bacterium]